METGASEAASDTTTSDTELPSSAGSEEQCSPWAIGRRAVVASGLTGLFLLALHGCGIEPVQLLNGCLNVLIGWLRGASWVANHWETWAAFVCIWGVSAAALCESRRAALLLLWLFPPIAVLAFGAAHALWIVEPGLGWAVALLALLGLLSLVMLLSIDRPPAAVDQL